MDARWGWLPSPERALNPLNRTREHGRMVNFILRILYHDLKKKQIIFKNERVEWREKPRIFMN